MVAWRVAKSLLALRDEMKARYPGTPNPGFIGDDAHASRTSDHNPWVDDPSSSVNVVTAGDFYHRPQLGFDAGKFAEALKASKDPRIKYVIWNRRIWSLARDREGWRPYNGDNPHTGHCHLSVSPTKSLYDSTRHWAAIPPKPKPPGGTTPTPRPPEDDMPLNDADKKWLQQTIERAADVASHRWALWGALYRIETADEMAFADAEYEKAIEAGLTPEQARLKVAGALSELRADLKAGQAKL